MYNFSDVAVHFKRRYCSLSAAKGVQLERYIQRQTAANVGNSHHTVKDVLELAEKCGIEWPVDDDVTNVELEKLFYPERKTAESHYVYAKLKVYHSATKR